jgi:hypothetical protein
MATYAYVGDTAYELIYKEDPDLTEAQAEALAAEYSKLGLPWKKCKWNGHNSVIAKASPQSFNRFCERRGAEWQSIRDRVGYSGLTIALNNRYQPGVTEPDMAFLSGPEWKAVVASIKANYDARPIERGTGTGSAAQPKKSWWRFW